MVKLDFDTLNYAIEHGIIEEMHVQEQVELFRRNELLAQHNSKIWEGENGYWYTYLPDLEKGRLLKRRKTRESLEDLVVAYWKQQIDNPTVQELYEEWIQRKLNNGEIALQTKDRYDRQYKQCMQEFGKRRIKALEPLDIEDFMLGAIHQNELTQKGYGNLKTIMYGLFRRAKKKGLVNFSITEVINDIEISRNAFRRTYKDDDELVFLESEQALVESYLLENKDLVNLGIYLLFKTGLRPGELSALKKEDVRGNVLHICRTEISYQCAPKKYAYEVRDFPKTEAGIRDVVIPDTYLWIFKSILGRSSSGEYLFERNGERLKSYQFRCRLGVICNKLEIVKKSPNKIRKTYASVLIDAGVESSVIMKQMGHTDITTTYKSYFKNRKDLTQRAEALNKVVGL